MSWKRWLFTAASFAAVLGVSLYFFLHWWRAGGVVALPARAHLWALAAVIIEIVSRSLKLSWGARSLRIRLPFWMSVRTSLAGDFGASVTPARSGSEPARFLVLVESGLTTANALVVLYIEVLLDSLSLAFVVLCASFVFRGQSTLIAALWGVVTVYAAAPVGMAVIALWLARRPQRHEPPSWVHWVGITASRWMVIDGWFGRFRKTVDRVRGVDMRWIGASFTASVVHVGMRLCVLPALVLGAGAVAPVAPLALWPLALLYGASIVPAPGGGGAVELAFKAALGGVIGPHYFFAALLWWRFYTFYLSIVIGGIAAGRTAMRALRKRKEIEVEMLSNE